MAKNIRTQRFEIPVKFLGDSTNLVSALKTAQAELDKLNTIKSPNAKQSNVAKELEQQIGYMKKAQEEYSKIEGVVTTRFSDVVKKNGTSLKDFENSVKSAAKENAESTARMAKGFEDLSKPIVNADNALTKFSRTLSNSIRYQVVNKSLDSVMGLGSEVVKFLEDTDENLNNIRIVSGKTNAEMQGLLKTSQIYSQGLNTTTNEFLKASEVYYQQGLAASEVLSRTTATIQAANVSGQGVAQTADQITSVLNGFNLSASEIVPTLDKIAALGAGTATDFEEIAKASQKVASAANEAGMGLNETLAMISTISSVTREAPEAVGTSLNAIIGRFNKLTVAEVDNVTSYTSQVEKAFASTASGLTMFEEEGMIKDRIQIFNELAAKWGQLDENQRMTITTAIAGTRQANKLMALMGNWDSYQEYLDMAVNSQGELSEQADVYADSLDAAQKRVQLAKEEMFSSLFNVDVLKDFNNLLADAVEFTSNILKNIGGMGGILKGLGSVIAPSLVKMAAPALTSKMLDPSNANRGDRKEADANYKVIEDTLSKQLGQEVQLLTTKQRGIALNEQQAKQYEKAVAILVEEGNRQKEILEIKNQLGLKDKESYKDAQNKVAILEQQTKEMFVQADKANKDAIQAKQNEISALGKSKRASKKGNKDELNKELEVLREREASQGTYALSDMLLGNNKNAKFDIAKGFSELFEKDLIKKELAGKSIDVGIEDLFPIEDIFSPEKMKNYFNKLSSDQMITFTGELQKEVAQATQKAFQLEGNALDKITGQASDKSGDVAGAKRVLNETKKSARISQSVDAITRGTIAAANAFQVLKTVTDDSLTSQEKASSSLVSIGTTMAAFPGLVGAAGMAIATIGPMLVEAFGFGESAIKKTMKQIDASIESTKEQTRIVKEQGIALKSVELLYDKLAESYANGSLEMGNLTEEQASMYGQVAEYVEQYAPELIKYYDAEGQAVIDLTKGYSKLGETKKNYLRQSLEDNQQDVFSRVGANSADSGQKLMQGYGIAISEVNRLKGEIAGIQGKALTDSKASEKLDELNTKLAENQGYLTKVNENWNTLFLDGLTKGTDGFYNLSSSVQNSILANGSFNSYLSSNILSIQNFGQEIQKLIEQLGTMSEEGVAKFESMSEGIRNAIFKFAMELDSTPQSMQKFLDGITEEDFSTGAFLPETISRQEYELESVGGPTPEQNYEEVSRINYELEKQREIIKDINANSYHGDFGLENYDSEGAAQATERIKELESDLDRVTSAASRASTASQDIFAGWANSMRELAASSNESFNSVVDSFNSVRDELSDSIDLGLDADTISEIQDRADALYAALMGNDREYFNSWRENNLGALTEVSQNYGIYAEDYATLNEYMAAVDAQKAQYKVIVEAAATGQVVDIEKEYAKFKNQTLISQALQDKNAKKAAVLTAGKASEKEALYSLEASKKILKGMEARIAAAKANGETTVSISNQEVEAVSENLEKATAAGVKAVNTFKPGSLAMASIKTTGTASIESVEKAIQDALSGIDEQIKEVVDGASGKDIDGLEKIFDDLIGGSQEMPKFNWSTDRYKPIDYKPVTKPGSSKGTPTSAPGSGKDKAKKEKNVEDLKFDIDPLKPYNDKIKEITHNIEQLKSERDKLYGKAYIDSLNKEVELNKELLKVEQAKLAKAKEIGEAERKRLSAQGVKFDNDGLIANYNEMLKAKEAYANSLSGDEKEKAKKDAQDFKKMMDEYEKYSINAVRESEKAIQKIKQEMTKIAQEKIEYPIDLIIRAHKGDKEIIDFIASTEKYKRGEIHFGVTASQNAQQLIESLQTVQEMFSQTGDGQSFINSILADPSLADNPKAQLEMIEKQQQKMMELGKELSEFGEKFRKSFEDGLGQAVKILEGELNKYKNITLQYNRMLEVSDALGKNSVSDISNMYGKLEGIYRNNFEQSVKVSEMLKESRDAFNVGTEEWLIANDKYLDAQATVLEQEKQLADLLGKQYDSTVSAGRKELEKALFGGGTSEDALSDLNSMNEERAKYLDTERKIYELNKFESQMRKEIQKYEHNPALQKKLQKFMDEEMAHLKGKEKLSKTELELSMKEYEVRKAQIELEKARDGDKMKLMLQRNQDGTFGHIYVRDTEQMEQAQQKYNDAVDQLYQYSIKKTEELQKESIDIRNKALSEYDKLNKQLKAGTISQEEYVERLRKAYNKMGDDLRKNAEEQARMQQSATTAKLLQILGVSEQELGQVDGATDSLQKVFDILGQNGEVGLTGVMEKLGLDSSNYVGSVGEQVAQMLEDLGGDDGAMKTLMEAFAETGDSTAATIMGLLMQTSDLSTLTEEILKNSLDGSGANFEDFLEKISSGAINTEDLFTETIINGLDEVELTWDSLQQRLIKDLDSFIKEFDITNPESTLGSVTNSIVAAYNKYNETLEDSLSRLEKSEADLAQSTKELNKNLDDTVSKLRDEIKEVTEITKKYVDLRNEVLKSIEEVTKYVKVLDDARKAIEEGNKPKGTATSGSGSTGGNSSGGSGGNQATTRPAPGVGLSSGKRVKIVGDAVYESAYGDSALKVYPDYLNSSRTDLSIDGQANGRYRVAQKGGGWIGWFNPGALQAFHTGGKVGTKEGMALLKEGEEVVTENAIKALEAVMKTAMQLQNFTPDVQQMSNVDNSKKVEMTVHASFPNATSSTEIEGAIRGLSLSAKQQNKD